MKYFEIDFGEGTDNDRICIRGLRKPTIDEASEFCRAEEKMFGQKVTMVTEISLEEAKAFYNMDNMARFPIFGKYRQ